MRVKKNAPAKNDGPARVKRFEQANAKGYNHRLALTMASNSPGDTPSMTDASRERWDSPALEYSAGRTREKINKRAAEEEGQGIRGATGETGTTIYGAHDNTATSKPKKR
jgi:hypothetical protein